MPNYKFQFFEKIGYMGQSKMEAILKFFQNKFTLYSYFEADSSLILIYFIFFLLKILHFGKKN